MRATFATSLALVSVALHVGCAIDADLGDDGDGRFGKADELADEDIPALAGHYSIESLTEMTYCNSANKETCDNTETPLHLEARMLLRITGQDRARWSGAITVCDVSVSKKGELLGTTEDGEYLQRGILARVGEVAVAGSLVEVDGQPALTLDPAALLVGASLDNPLEDDLPTDRKDEHVADADADGKPGISIKLPLGRRIFFGARATVDRWQLSMSSDESFSGPADYRVDVSVYGDTIPFFDAADEADDALGKIFLPTHEHDVSMQPAGDTSCAQVMQRFE